MLVRGSGVGDQGGGGQGVVHGVHGGGVGGTNEFFRYSKSSGNSKGSIVFKVRKWRPF